MMPKQYQAGNAWQISCALRELLSTCDDLQRERLSRQFERIIP